MAIRAETAAATRAALLAAASQLLDEGGLDAVTLRAVGERAKVSRSAPYGHFRNKEHLLAQLAIDAWNSLADEVAALRRAGGTSTGLVERAISTLIDVARRRPHVYRLMFNSPVDTPTAAAAVDRLQRQFLELVTALVGTARTPAYAALLLSSAHGIAGLELSGHLAKREWGVDPAQLVHILVDAVQARAAR